MNRSAPIKRILIFRLSSMGDIILASGLIRCLRHAYPHAEITFAVKEVFVDLIRHNPHISNVLVLKRKTGIGTFIAQIKQGNYDWMIDIHRNYRSFLVRLRVGIPLVTSYSKHLFRRNLLVMCKWNRHTALPPIRQRYFKAVAEQGVVDDGKGSEIFLGDAAPERAIQILADAGIAPTSPIIAICPGASFSNKEWPVERFVDVARHFATQGKYAVCLLGSAKDSVRCDEIRTRVGAGVFSFAGTFSLLETGAVISRASVVLTHDSGLMHMVQGIGKPIVALFGSTVTELGYAPYPPNATIIQKEVACRPCTHNGLNRCPKGHFRCMREIQVAEVIQAMEENREA